MEKCVSEFAKRSPFCASNYKPPLNILVGIRTCRGHGRNMRLVLICAIRFVSKSVRKSRFLLAGYPGSLNGIEGSLATQTGKLSRVELGLKHGLVVLVSMC